MKHSVKVEVGKSVLVIVWRSVIDYVRSSLRVRVAGTVLVIM